MVQGKRPVTRDQQPFHLKIARLRIRHEAKAARPVVNEDALNGDRVVVDVQIERGLEALDRGHGAAAPAADSALRGSPALEGQERADEDAENGAAELVIPSERVTQTVGQRQYLLANGKTAEHVVGQVRGQLRHPPPAARGTEGAPPAREGDQDLVPALVAAEARKAPCQNARQSGAEMGSWRPRSKVM